MDTKWLGGGSKLDILDVKTSQRSKKLNNKNMNEFKNEKGRIDVLSSQYMAGKLKVRNLAEISADYIIRREIAELLTRQPFAVKRQVARGLMADVHEVVYKNMNDRKKRRK
jgi:hypothetical protein